MNVKQGEETKLGIFKYDNERLSHETKLILLLKNKQKKKDRHTKKVNLLNMAIIILSIVSTRLQNYLHAFKVTSSDILFPSSLISVLNEPIFC